MSAKRPVSPARPTGSTRPARQSAPPSSPVARRQRIQQSRQQAQEQADREGRLLTAEELDQIALDGEREAAEKTARRAQEPPSKQELLRLMAAEEWEQQREAEGLHEPISGYDPYRTPEYLAQRARASSSRPQTPPTTGSAYDRDLPTQEDLDRESYRRHYRQPDADSPTTDEPAYDDEGYDEGYDPDYDEEHQVETEHYYAGRYDPVSDYDEPVGPRRSYIVDEGEDYESTRRPMPARPLPRDRRALDTQRMQVVTADPDDPMAGMPPVPQRRKKPLSDWIDLGNLTDDHGRHPHAEWAGWCVRVRRTMPLGFLQAVEEVQLATWEARQRRALSGVAAANARPVLQAGKIVELIRAGVAVWNFPDPLGRPMPQPFEMGWERSLDPDLLSPVFDAIMREVSPPKAGSRSSNRR